MRVTVNGEARELAPETRTVRDLLEALTFPLERVAVEQNGALLRRATLDDVVVAEGDAFEIVTLVGGG